MRIIGRKLFDGSKIKFYLKKFNIFVINSILKFLLQKLTFLGLFAFKLVYANSMHFLCGCLRTQTRPAPLSSGRARAGRFLEKSGAVARPACALLLEFIDPVSLKDIVFIGPF